MKILYISHGRICNEIEYFGDMMFHGFKSFDEFDVYTVNEPWYMFKDPLFADPNTKNRLYGKGFSISNLIDNSKVVKS